MGSRAVALVCRGRGDRGLEIRRGRRGYRRDVDEDRPVVLRRRTDREACSARLRQAVRTAGLFDELSTSWLLLDAELLPWSAKAAELLRTQYAAVAAAATHALPAAVQALEHGGANRAGGR